MCTRRHSHSMCLFIVTTVLSLTGSVCSAPLLWRHRGFRVFDKFKNKRKLVTGATVPYRHRLELWTSLYQSVQSVQIGFEANRWGSNNPIHQQRKPTIFRMLNIHKSFMWYTMYGCTLFFVKFTMDLFIHLIGVIHRNRECVSLLWRRSALWWGKKQTEPSKKPRPSVECPT